MAHLLYHSGRQKLVKSTWWRATASKIVYLIRDPRDIALAVQRFCDNDFMKKFAGSYANKQRIADPEWGNKVASFLRRRKELKVHVVFYERLLWQWEPEYSRLLDYLGLHLADCKKQAVRKAASFAEMKKEVLSTSTGERHMPGSRKWTQASRRNSVGSMLPSWSFLDIQRRPLKQQSVGCRRFHTDRR